MVVREKRGKGGGEGEEGEGREGEGSHLMLLKLEGYSIQMFVRGPRPKQFIGFIFFFFFFCPFLYF